MANESNLQQHGEHVEYLKEIILPNSEKSILIKAKNMLINTLFGRIPLSLPSIQFESIKRSIKKGFFAFVKSSGIGLGGCIGTGVISKYIFNIPLDLSTNLTWYISIFLTIFLAFFLYFLAKQDKSFPKSE